MRLIGIMSMLVIAQLAFGWVATASAAAETHGPATQPSESRHRAALPKPTSHTTRTIEGWTVHVDDRLLTGPGPDQELGNRALKLLANRLFEITGVVPADRLKRLQQVPIWLDLSHGELFAAQYHPSADWLKENGYDTAMAKAVHLPNVKDFLNPTTQHQQPWMVLHELAHAYHDQVLGFEDPQIHDAWRRFVDSGKYKSVLHMSGRMEPHYGLKDEHEFFAEMTEAYFGMNDFYPFNGVELAREEPELYELLKTIWGPVP